MKLVRWISVILLALAWWIGSFIYGDVLDVEGPE